MEKQYKVGIDLGNKYNQISYFDTMKNEPVSVLKNQCEDAYFMPNILFYSEKSKKWTCGEQAQKNHEKSEKGTIFTDVMNPSKENEVVFEIEGKSYLGKDLFCELIGLQLEYSFGHGWDKKIENIVFTMEKPDRKKRELLWYFADKYGIKRKKISISSYINSNLHFIFSQERAIWVNGVIIFKYENEKLSYYTVRLKRNSHPAYIEVSDEIELPMPEFESKTNNPEFEEALGLCLQKAIGSQPFSGVYLTGQNFEIEIPQKVIKYLCQGRRIFLGQNLYVKGAALQAKENSEETGKGNQLLIKSDDFVLYDIAVCGYYRGKEALIPIVQGGEEWFYSTGKAEVILDGENHIELQFIDKLTKKSLKEVIQIKGLPERPPKTTRLELSIEFLNGTQGTITIKDKGFGTLYPTTGKIYRKEFTLT